MHTVPPAGAGGYARLFSHIDDDGDTPRMVDKETLSAG